MRCAVNSIVCGRSRTSSSSRSRPSTTRMRRTSSPTPSSLPTVSPRFGRCDCPTLWCSTLLFERPRACCGTLRLARSVQARGVPWLRVRAPYPCREWPTGRHEGLSRSLQSVPPVPKQAAARCSRTTQCSTRVSSSGKPNRPTTTASRTTSRSPPSRPHPLLSWGRATASGPSKQVCHFFILSIPGCHR